MRGTSHETNQIHYQYGRLVWREPCRRLLDKHDGQLARCMFFDLYSF